VNSYRGLSVAAATSAPRASAAELVACEIQTEAARSRRFA